jgi:hypothetical protein
VSQAAGGANLQEFTSSGTWTKPSGAKFVMVELWSGGGGGGSGARSFQNFGTPVSTQGGGGGGGGAYSYRLFNAPDLSATELVTIGSGGAGATAQTTDNTDGNNGSDGGNTSFGQKISSFGGGGGGGGIRSSNIGPGGGVGGGLWQAAAATPAQATNLFNGGQGGYQTNAAQAIAGASSFQGAGGGGYGAWFTITSTGAFGESYPATNGGSNIGPLGGGANGASFPGTVGGAGVGQKGGGGGGVGRVSAVIGNTGTMCFGNSTFAYATTAGLIYTSADGTTSWTIRNAPSASWILHDGTRFVLFSADASRCWTTTDFVTYTERVAPSVGGNVVSRVKYVNGNYFVLTNSVNLYRSTDLVTWTTVVPSTVQPSEQWKDITWSGTRYVLAGVYYVRHSTDLITWTASTGVNPAGFSQQTCASNGAGIVVVQTGANAQQCYRSTDNGISFTATATSLGSQLPSLNFLNSLFILTSGQSIWTSTDGNTWAARSTTAGVFLRGGIAWDGTTYVIGTLGDFAAGTLGASAIMAVTAVPASLNTWTQRSLTGVNGPGGTGGTGGGSGGGGGGGGGSSNGFNSGAGGAGGNGLVRVYTW